MARPAGRESSQDTIPASAHDVKRAYIFCKNPAAVLTRIEPDAAKLLDEVLLSTKRQLEGGSDLKAATPGSRVRPLPSLVPLVEDAKRQCKEVVNGFSVETEAHAQVWAGCIYQSESVGANEIL